MYRISAHFQGACWLCCVGPFAEFLIGPLDIIGVAVSRLSSYVQDMVFWPATCSLGMTLVREYCESSTHAGTPLLALICT